MSRVHRPIFKAAGISALALLLLTVPATRSQAQYFGYGGYGYPGYGYGFPGAFYGYGFAPGGFGGFGGPFGYGIGPGYGFATPGVSYGYYGSPYVGVGAPLISGAGDTNPLLGLGLTPLGVQSALTETNWIRGTLPRNAAKPAAPAAPVRPR